jgi:ankyrin repeat protein
MPDDDLQPTGPATAPAASALAAGSDAASADARPTPATATPEPAPVQPTPSARARTTTPDPSLDLPLIAAAARGDAGEVRRLLAQGASVRATDERGRTPLVAAAYGNHLETARRLLRAGADPDEKDATVQSAYLIATSEVGDDPRLLALLLAAGADVTARDSFNGTGLIRAAERGFPRVVRLLLRSGVEVDHVNRLGWTALHEAIVLGDGSDPYVQVVQALVAAGADVDLPSARDGVRPLTHARSRGQQDVAAVLEAAGARP